MLSKQIEKAQKKVEEQNFLIRKRVLEYDDVMNEQRRVVYEYRDEVLEGRDMGAGRARERSPTSSAALVDEYTVSATTSRTGTSTACSPRCADIFPVGFGPDDSTGSATSARSSSRSLAQRRADALRAAARRSSARSSCARWSATCCCRSSTTSWREHLYDMDYLREGIHLRGFAQIDPLVAYKNEAFDLFTDLMNIDLVATSRG